MKHYPPAFRVEQFHCPYCGVYARQFWSRLIRDGNGAHTPVHCCRCSHCNKFSYWFETDAGGYMFQPNTTSAPPPHVDMPLAVRSDYDEAAAIFDRSPKGAAAILRLGVQKLLHSLGLPGRNINEDIGQLVAAGLPIEVQQALDFCRVVGNNAVHPGEIQIDDTPEMAAALFEMMNFIVQDRISRPKQVAELYARLPSGALQAIERRDGISE